MRTITAKELREMLEDIPDNAKLAFASDYGDRANTQQVHFLRGDIDKTSIRESGYSDSGWAVDEDGEGDESVWIIS